MSSKERLFFIRVRIFFRCLAGCIIALFIFSQAHLANADYTPFSATKLVADADSRISDKPDKIPLILIHGFTGTDQDTFDNIDGTTADEKEYFYEFIEHFYTTLNLNDAYKLYRYHYLSNVTDDNTIAQDLLLWLEEFIRNGDIDDTDFVLVGHSMGGLISRSYMEEKTHTIGKYKDKKGGERIRSLITLATPHHGSPTANDLARDSGDADWNGLLHIIDAIFWGPITIKDPNRSDLRWDNYNGMQGSNSTGYEDEKNQWLFSLNADSVYHDKIIAYYGGIKDNSGEISAEYSLKELWEQLMANSSTSFSALYSACELNGFLPGKNNNPILYPYRGPYEDNRPFTFRMKLCFASVLLHKIYEKDNDGLVPADSGRFENLNLRKLRWFEGFDHWDMKSDRIGKPKELLLKLEQDLGNTETDRSDITNALRILAGIPVSADNPMKPDVSGDGKVDLSDVVCLLQYLSDTK